MISIKVIRATIYKSNEDYLYCVYVFGFLVHAITLKIESEDVAIAMFGKDRIYYANEYSKKICKYYKDFDNL